MYDDLDTENTRMDDRLYIVRATGGRYLGKDLKHAREYVGITSVFSIKQWGTKGYK